MIVRLDTHRLQTLDQVREFLAGSEQVDLQPQTRADSYAFVAKTVRRFDYALRGKADKGLLRRFLAKVAGLSRAQITRLLQQHRTTGEIADRRDTPRRPFPRRYSNADIGLLAELDVLHGTLSGPATRKLCARAFHLFGDRRFERLAGISNGHLYNLRHTTSYQRRRGTTPLPTRPVQVAIGERRRPQPFGQPGWVRVDTVHQGDLDGIKGLYHVNLVDEVTQFQCIGVFIRAAAWLLMAVVALVLLLACTNLASFLLTRALDRRKEIAVRLALGASRGSLVRRLLTETTLLGLLAGGAGTGLAVWLLQLLATGDFPLPIPVALDLRLDGRVLAFTLGVSLVAGAMLGLVPALQSTRPDVSGALGSESAGGGQPGQLRWRNALVVAQLTISLVLLVGAGLFLRSFQQAQSVDPGFGREPTAILTFLTPATRFAPDEARVYTRRLLDRFRELPGVDAVGAISRLHLNPLSTSTSDFNVAGFEPPGDHGAFIADRAEVDPGFFEAAGIEIRGRNFSDADRPDTQPVVIISEAMARRFWDDGDAVGRLVQRRADEDPPWLVVGVASDAKVRTLGEAPRNMVYLTYSQRLARSLTVVAKTSTDPERTALALLTAGREVDPDLWVFETKTMDRHLALLRLPQQLSAFVLSAFGLLALALAAIGLYGVVSHGVSQRTREIGIRMALGADGPGVVRLLVAGGLRLVVVGGAFGLALAVVATRPIGALLFEVDALDPLTFLGVPLVLGAVALLAAYLPARRASRVHPVTALRTD